MIFSTFLSLLYRHYVKFLQIFQLKVQFKYKGLREFCANIALRHHKNNNKQKRRQFTEATHWIHGCQFHFSKCLWKKIRQNKMKPYYSNTKNTEFSRFVRAALSIPFVPLDRLNEAMEILKQLVKTIKIKKAALQNLPNNSLIT